MKYIFITLAIIFISSCATETEKLNDLYDVSYKPNGSFDLGSLDSTIYCNKYFGFSFKCPSGNWYILDNERFNQDIDKGVEVSVDAGIEKKELEITKDNFHNLITIEKKNPNGSETSYQTISICAENLKHFKDVSSVVEYFKLTDNYLKENFSSTNPKNRAIGVENAIVNNKHFLVQNLEFDYESSQKTFQKTYCAKFDNYLLTIVVLYESEIQLKENLKILEDIRWD